ncbi:MAG: methylmalonyl-CoA mutase, partial [Deltaproteobacteria bacterium]|nr:methylmalonyl-CoA mutase [Deltaproteobacteria bacterium]
MSAKPTQKDPKNTPKTPEETPGEKVLRTLSGYPVPNFYTASDLKGFDVKEELGIPGEYPFTRGITKDMYREKYWVMSQYAGFGTARESNERFKYLIAKGGSGVGIALDLPTQLGMDSDHPQAQGEVGRTGVAIDSLRDIEIMLDGIPLEKVGIIRTTANAIGPIACAWLVALGEKRGCPPTSFSVRLQNDVLKEFVARGTHIFPPGPSVKLCIDALEYCARHVPNWLPLTACGSHMRQAGGKVKHELGFAIANAIAYSDEAIRRGLKIEDFAPTLTFHFLIHKDFFEEIAKYRAARR